MRKKGGMRSVLLVLLFAILLLAGLVGAPEASLCQILTEGFEGSFPPAGWSVINAGDSLTGPTWEQTFANFHSGTYSAFVHWGSPGEYQDEWLITSSLNLTSASFWRLSFWQSFWNWGSATDPSYVKVSTNPNQLDTTAYSTVWTLDITGPDPDTVWHEVLIDLSPYAGNPTVWVAWQYRGTDGQFWFIDDVEVDTARTADVMAQSILQPPYLVAPNASLSPEVWVRNVGASQQSFGVVCSIDTLGGPQVFLDTDSVSNLMPGDSSLCTFSMWQAGGDGAVYQVTAYTRLAGDQDPGNDTTTARTIAFDLTPVISSPYHAFPPTIDGLIDPAEWASAFRRDISDVLNQGGNGPFLPGSGYLYAMNDDNNLYLALDGVVDVTLNDFDNFAQYLDDNNDGSWPAYPDTGEGELWFFEHTGGDTVRFSPITTSGMQTGWDVPLSASSALTSGHMQFELVLPLGAAPEYLNRGLGETAGLWLWAQDMGGNGFYGCWPADAPFGGTDPARFGDLILGVGAHDCTPVSIDEPPATVYCDSTYTPTASVTNIGTAHEDSFPVYCTISPSYPVDTAWAYNVNPGDTAVVSWSVWTVPSAPDTYVISVVTDARQDTVHGNDSLAMQIYSIVGVEEGEELVIVPRVFALQQAVPNPFHRTADIRFQVPLAGHTSLRVYDLTGRLVRSLVDEVRKPGWYSVIWDGADGDGTEVTSGVYLYRLKVRPNDGGQAGEFVATRKLVVLR